MYIAVEVATVLVEMVTISIYLKGLFQKYEKNITFILLLYFAAGAGFAVLSILPVNPFIRMGYVFIFVALLAKLLFNIKWLVAGYSSLIFCAINIIVDNICSGIISVFGIPVENLYVYGNERILYIVLAKLVMIFCIYLVVKLSQWRRSQESLITAVPLLLCQVFSIFICYIMYLGSLKTATTITFSFIIGAVGVLYINIIIFVYVERVKAVGEIKKQNALAEQQYKSKLEYFEQVKEDQAETRALYHDINKYLNTMNDLINRNDIVHARECISQVSELFENIGKVVDVGNNVVSVVLNHGVQKARRLDIDIDLDVRVKPELNVASGDLCVIIGNTLDNAIEACAQLTDGNRKIALQLIEKNGMLLYEIRNPYDPNAPKPKKNPKQHGFGLKNVKRCVDRYKGIMQVSTEGGEYTVSIHLNIPPDTSGTLRAS